MTSAQTLIPATSAHAGLFSSLHEKAFAGSGTVPWSEENFAVLLAHPGAIAVLALSGTVPEGFALAQVAGGETEIITLGVLPGARRKGMGRCLVAELVRQGASRGASVLFLEVADDNPAAIGLYESAGFSRTGHRKGYYTRQNTAEKADALVMRRDIV